MRKIFSVVLAFFVMTGCNNSPSNLDEYDENLRAAFQDKPIGKSPAFALMKESVAGPAWLATIHGYPNNLSVCEELIAPYNEDPDLSVLNGKYYCQAV